jgi:hypothetical protein
MLTQKRPPRCQLLTGEGVTSNAQGEDQTDVTDSAHLGSAKVVKEIDVVWPSGVHQTLHEVPADQILTVTEKAGETAVRGSAVRRRK